MFDFEKPDEYQKAKSFNFFVYQYMQSYKGLDLSTKNQMRRAPLSIMLNIAEGSSRFSKADRRNFFVIARGSIFERLAIFDFMKEQKLLSEGIHTELYSKTEELSKMIYAIIKNLS